MNGQNCRALQRLIPFCDACRGEGGLFATMPSREPAQEHRAELIDGGCWGLPELRANLREMALADRLLGGQRATLARTVAWLDDLPADYCPRVLDIATGNATLPRALYGWSKRQGRPLQLVAGDINADVLLVARVELGKSPIHLLRHDALVMPFADGAFDIVTCTQALHHFDRATATRLLGELARVARVGVVVNDLRRSYVAYWLARFLACGPVTRLGRHDGPLSVLRAFTPDEVHELAREAALDVRVRRAPFRLLIEFEKRDRPLPAAA